jgi:lipid-A-disaccharide synthase
MVAKRLFIITGDYSGDVHAARVVDALKEREPKLELAAVGGENLRSRGVQLLSDQSKMGRMGAGSFLGAPYHYMLGKRILRFLKEFKPDAVLLIDYGGFNLWMAGQLKGMGLKVLYFIPPQVWASRRGRLKSIRKNVDHVFCIFPFEKALYEAENIPVTYVGHPLIGELPPASDRDAFCARHGLDANKPILGIFPGSRKMEIDYLLKELIATLPRLHKERPDVQFVLAKAASLAPDYFQKRLAEAWEQAGFPEARTQERPTLHVVENENHAVLSVSDVLIAKSGTTTLEAALYGTPMAIIYKGHPLIYPLAVWICYLPCIGLPNILTDMKNPPVPELWQGKVNPAQLTETLLPLLNRHSDAFQRQQTAFETIRDIFDVGNAPDNVAAGILERI